MGDDKLTAKTIYCPDCDEDYRLAYSNDRDEMYVVCDCGEAEAVADFVGRFKDEYDGADSEEKPRWYQ